MAVVVPKKDTQTAEQSGDCSLQKYVQVRITLTKPSGF